MNKQINYLLQKTNTQNTDPSLFSPEDSTHWLVCRDQRRGYQNTNTKDFTDFTIYRGEIQENIEEIQRFTRISPIYTQISTEHESHNVHTGYLLQKQTPNEYRSPLSSKMKKYTICITFGSQHIYWKLKEQISQF